MTRNTTIRLKLATSISYKIWQTVPWRTCTVPVRDVEFQHRSFWIGSHADLWLGSIYIWYPPISTKFSSLTLMLLISTTLWAFELPIPSHAGIIYGWSLRESERNREIRCPRTRQVPKRRYAVSVSLSRAAFSSLSLSLNSHFDFSHVNRWTAAAGIFPSYGQRLVSSGHGYWVSAGGIHASW